MPFLYLQNNNLQGKTCIFCNKNTDYKKNTDTDVPVLDKIKYFLQNACLKVILILDKAQHVSR